MSSSGRRRGHGPSAGPPFASAGSELGRRRTRTLPADSAATSIASLSLSLSKSSLAPSSPWSLSPSSSPLRSRAHEPPVSAQARLATLAHFISDNKWSAFADHIAAYPRDAKVTDPRTGRPLLYHALDLHRNDFARFLLAAYAPPTDPLPPPVPAVAVAAHAPAKAALSVSSLAVKSSAEPMSSAASFVGDISSTLLAMHPASHPLRSGSPISSTSSSPIPPPPRHLSGATSLGHHHMHKSAATAAASAVGSRPTSLLYSAPAAFGSMPSLNSNNSNSGSAAAVYRSPIRDFEGNSPLMVATRAKNTDMCEELLEWWPDMLHAPNVHGMTPLLAACQVGSEMLVTLFLDLGASLSHADNDGNTALHHAAAYNHFSIVALLVARGANFMVRNRKRWTPLDYAYSETLQAFFQDLVRDSVLGGPGDFGGLGDFAVGGESSQNTSVLPGTGSVLYSSPLMPAAARRVGGAGAAGGSVNNSARSVVTLNDAGGWLSGGAGHGLPAMAPAAEGTGGGGDENKGLVDASPSLAMELPALDMSYFAPMVTSADGPAGEASTGQAAAGTGEAAAKPTLRSYNAFLD
ncbi:hypothetical protein BCR44DRAFT_83244 [Catenaria anguillulae PL171]|uniref:Uncharacterized protein n=1 Tax=Catenaria anguillulae PL171 TaxID=765915 RepID=A0A1Y2HHP6_9FUNG|nr:hypothetical protein BCR44DRAFT_83244 [Catenaria anguillulae PL171]